MSTSVIHPRVETFKQDSGIKYHICWQNLAGEDRQAFGFFGNRHSTRERLECEFPEFKLIGVRQTHSNILTLSPFAGEPPEADAHWTRESHVAICIRTADCVPVLIFDLQNSIAVAVHAGWRGVENEILVKSLLALKAQGFSAPNAVAFIGPHIMQKSFEVGLDVAEKLKAAFFRSAPQEIFPAFEIKTLGAERKTHVDLDLIVRAQLVAAGIPVERQTCLSIDTVTSQDHESFRRDRERSGRQISFAAILK